MAPPARRRVRSSRWALIVGISTYQHADWVLRFADADALAMEAFFRSPEGGAFDHIEVLTNEKATLAAITRGLRSYLQDAAEEDLVVIYLSGHGKPDPRRLENFYFLTHDTDPADIAGTALPMYAIETSLRSHIRAGKVVILADTCHSGRIGEERGGDTADGEAILDAYLDALARSKRGVAMLTSSRGAEVSTEGAQFGGGHGVFTHYLLEGLRGAADGFGGEPRDGKVSAHELFEYVCASVKKATGNKQNPRPKNTDDDRAFTLAVLGRSTADGMCTLGQNLARLAAELGDVRTLRLANDALEEAIDLAGHTGLRHRDAELALAQSHVLAGRYAEALALVAALPDQATWPEDAWVLHAMCTAATRPVDEARDALRRAARYAPGQPWLAEYADWLGRTATATVHALFVGVEQFDDPAWPPLRGCTNDARAMRDVLMARPELAGGNVVVLESGIL